MSTPRQLPPIGQMSAIELAELDAVSRNFHVVLPNTEYIPDGYLIRQIYVIGDGNIRFDAINSTTANPNATEDSGVFTVSDREQFKSLLVTKIYADTNVKLLTW